MRPREAGDLEGARGPLDEKTVIDVRDERTIIDERTIADEGTVTDEGTVSDERTITDDGLPLLGTGDAERLEKPKRRRSRWRWVGWFFGILFIALAVFGVVLAVFWDPILRAIIVAQAKRHGIDLAFDSVEVHRDRLVFVGARIHADDLPDVDARAEHLVVALDPNFAPTSAVISDLHVTIVDAPGIAISAHDATANIVDFAPQKLALKGVDVEAESVESLLGFARVGLTPPLVLIAPSVTDLHVGVAAVSSAWRVPLAVDASTISIQSGSATLRQLKTTIPIVDMPVSLDSVEVRHEGASFALHVPEAPYLDLGVDEHASTVHVVLRKVSADLLAAKLHWSRPPGFALSATAEISLPRGAPGEPTGTFNATLEHYVPPHPIELNGIVFGDATKGRGSFKLHGGEADLTDLHVDAGDLHMTGTGTAKTADSGSITLSLDGSVPCNELAVSAVAAHLGLAAGFVTGELAADHLGGTVEVKLGVVIEGKKASEPEIHPAAFVHCSLAL